MAGHGGKRPGAGRKPGVVSKAKRDLAEMAKAHGEAALRALVQIATKGESESARVAASVAILDRAYGKPVPAPEPVTDDDVLPVTVTIGRRKAVGNVRVTGAE